MKMTVVGGGYVGLVSGVCFASTGNHVTIADVDRQRVEDLRAGWANRMIALKHFCPADRLSEFSMPPHSVQADAESRRQQ